MANETKKQVEQLNEAQLDEVTGGERNQSKGQVDVEVDQIDTL